MCLSPSLLWHSRRQSDSPSKGINHISNRNCTMSFGVFFGGQVVIITQSRARTMECVKYLDDLAPFLFPSLKVSSFGAVSDAG